MDTVPDTTPTQDLSVNLTMAPNMANGLRVYASALEVAQAYSIESDEDATAVNTELRRTKAGIVEITKWRQEFVEPATIIIERAKDRFNGPIENLKAAEAHYKGLLMDWTAKKQREAEEAQRKADAEERARRQEAERVAAAERARAEEKAREQERIAREQEEARQKAEAEGNARAMAAAAAAAASAQARAAAEREKGESKANEAVMVAAATSAATVVPAAQKVEGFSVRTSWVAELAENTTEARAVKKIAYAIAGVAVDKDGNRSLVPTKDELIPALKIDMSAATNVAKGLKTAFNIPGLAAVQRSIAASRK